MHFLAILKSQSPRWRCQQDCAPCCKALGENPSFVSSSSGDLGSLACWQYHSDLCLCLYITFSLVCISNLLHLFLLSIWWHVSPTKIIQAYLFISITLNVFISAKTLLSKQGSIDSFYGQNLIIFGVTSQAITPTRSYLLGDSFLFYLLLL